MWILTVYQKDRLLMYEFETKKEAEIEMQKQTEYSILTQLTP